MRNPFIKKKKDEAAARRIAREEYAMKETLRELGIDIDTLIGKMMDDNSSAYTGVE
uniref:Uncharacterized protein n=1 Tax=Myoviridae sp. ctxbQ4 TaxID=2827292 RepID=A0A8S5R5I5_9CAUD|nr:MAG TPA: hypothetical protein [Myoviridae sp. ctxbQ4]